MRVCILSVQVPFITGGAELHAIALKEELVKQGCEAEIVTIPFKWYPPEHLLDCMLMARLMDVREVNGRSIDRVIALKFPAYYASHDNKTCWVLHQHRQAYDLYGTPLSDLSQTDSGRAVAAEIKRWDDAFLPESKRIFANSRTVAARLARFNNITAAPLYHPPFQHHRFKSGRFDKYIFYPGRFDEMKRQALLFDALVSSSLDLQIVFCGSSDSRYGADLLKRIADSSAANRVKVLGQISEAEKIELYANCLAVYNGVLDEDYGYVTLEAFCAGKPVITHTDSGGPLEFVTHGLNGLVTEPTAEALGEAISQLANHPAAAERMGQAGKETLRSMSISWSHVLEQLLG